MGSGEWRSTTTKRSTPLYGHVMPHPTTSSPRTCHKAARHSLCFVSPEHCYDGHVKETSACARLHFLWFCVVQHPQPPQEPHRVRSPLMPGLQRADVWKPWHAICCSQAHTKPQGTHMYRETRGEDWVACVCRVPIRRARWVVRKKNVTPTQTKSWLQRSQLPRTMLGGIVFFSFCYFNTINECFHKQVSVKT